jgi:hypothetical protein
MYQIGKHFIYVSLFATLLLLSEAASTTDNALLHTINHLLNYVDESNCVFIRNGKEYNSKEAAKHMKMKCDSFKDEIKTPEEFIELTASKSLVSGQPYLVRCADHSPIPSADWLAKELSNYRRTLHGNTFTK